MVRPEPLPIQDQQWSIGVPLDPQPAGLSPGQQSRVEIVISQGETLAAKAMAHNKGLTRESADRIARQYLVYRSQLIERGWLLPRLHNLALQRTDLGGIAIRVLEDYVPGGDMAHQLADQSYSDLGSNDLVVFALAHFLEKARETGGTMKIDHFVFPVLDIGIDYKPANIVIKGGSVWLVDQFGPKMINPERPLLMRVFELDMIASNALLFLCATAAGVIARFLWLSYDVLKPGVEYEQWASDRVKGLEGVSYPGLRLEVAHAIKIVRRIYSDLRFDRTLEEDS